MWWVFWCFSFLVLGFFLVGFFWLFLWLCVCGVLFCLFVFGFFSPQNEVRSFPLPAASVFSIRLGCFSLGHGRLVGFPSV